jgi:subtilisin family serine protease
MNRFRVWRFTALLAVIVATLTISTSPVDAATNDPRSAEQWALTAIGVDAAWTVTRGAGVTVAVIDSGSGPHPDLDANLDVGRNLFMGADEVGAPDVDTVGHGTHVAGIIAAVANNGIGVVGVAPESRILPIRVLGPDGRGRSGDVIAAVRLAADSGARVINLSLGGDQESPGLSDAIRYANDKGALVIAAAGNDGPAAAPKWPAAFELTIAVAFTDQQNAPSPRSQSGEYIDIAAPGVSILSTAGGDYAYSSGSSMAAGFVSGAAALLFAARPALTNAQVRDILLRTATDIAAPGIDPLTGFGLLNLRAAFAELARLFPIAGAPTITALGHLNENVRAVVAPRTATQWYRCRSAGQVQNTRPQNCTAIPNAITVNYRIGTRDLNTFLRVSSRNRRTNETFFSATTPRVVGVWPLLATVTANSSTPGTQLVRTPSKGTVVLRVTGGGCRVKKNVLIAPPESGICRVRANVQARSPYPAMANTFTVGILAP